MKKQTAVLIGLIAVILIAVGAYVGIRMQNQGKDIIGITTLNDENKVIMNSATGEEFVSGSGLLKVADGEHIHLSWKLKSGSFDIGFGPSEGNNAEALMNLDMTELETPGTMPETYAIEQKGVEGEGELDFEAQSGDYAVYFTMNGAVGTATVTAAKN